MPCAGSMLEPLVAARWHILVRFGRWDEILEQPIIDDLPIMYAHRP